MHSIKNDMIGALNQFFSAQAEEEGKCLVDYAQFDTEYELVFTDKPVADAEAVLVPRGGTALNDAIGKSVVELGEKLAKLKEGRRPGQVIVAVVTDGGENSSKEWTVDAVKELVKKQEDKYDWTFTFLGANMDAVTTGMSYGFSKGNSMTYDVHNTGQTVAAMSANVTRTRSGLASGYTDEERKAAVAK